MEFSVHRPSPSNTYSYVQEENLGSTRKFVKKLLLVYLYFQPNSCNVHTQSMNGEWAPGTFLRQRRKVPPAHAQQVLLIGGWVAPTEFSWIDWFQPVLQADIAEWSAGAPLVSRVASDSSWLLVAPILWPRERTRVIMANSGLCRHTTANLLSWLICADVVLLTIKMYQHSFSSFFLFIYCSNEYHQP